MTSIFLSFFLALFLLLLSISGYGNFFFNISRLNSQISQDYRNIEFIFGLIFVGTISIITNLFINFNDQVSLFFITIGIILYFIFFFKKKNKLDEIKIIIFILVISFLFSFYSLNNDDFDYHFRTILNFKDFNTFNIVHERTTSYNSHWLIINSIFYLKIFPASVFCIVSILYSFTLLDFYKSFKRNKVNENYLALIYSFFVLIFLLGVLNGYKEYGTDIPGQIISFYLILIYFEYNKNGIENNLKLLSILFLLLFFAFTIKISNVLIGLLFVLFFIRTSKKIHYLIISSILAIPSFFWLMQNYIISKCIVWPITLTCFQNITESKEEMYAIEVFAKGDPTTSYKMEGLNWVPMWIKNHSYKLFETYTVYFILMLIPCVVFLFYKRISLNLYNNFKNYFLRKNNPFKGYCIVIIICNIIWFVQSPAYRFGIFYNLNFLLILLIPIWYEIYLKDKIFFNKSVKILIYISLVFFIANNFTKYKEYIDRHGFDWPNIQGDVYNNKLNQ